MPRTFPSASTSLWQTMSRDGFGFSAVSGFVTIAGTSETDFILIRNPQGSGVLVRLYEFTMTLGASATQRSLFRFYRAPTVSDVGTPMTINKVLATHPNTSKINVYQTPTISNRGSLIQLFSVEFTSLRREQDLSRYLVNGADILVTVQASTNNIEHNLVSVWAEEPL